MVKILTLVLTLHVVSKQLNRLHIHANCGQLSYTLLLSAVCLSGEGVGWVGEEREQKTRA